MEYEVIDGKKVYYTDDEHSDLESCHYCGEFWIDGEPACDCYGDDD